MNGNKLLDTNILIYLSKKTIHLEDISGPQTILHLSVISYMEALGYNFSNSNEKMIIEKLCSELNIINLDNKIIAQTIKIKQNKKIKLPDAIIAATALTHNLQLITANALDFKGINQKLIVVNPLS